MGFEIRLGKPYVHQARPAIAEVISEINRRSQQPSYGRWILGGGGILALGAGFWGSIGVGIGIAVLAAGIAWWHHRRVLRQRQTQLIYELGDDVQEQFNTIQQAFQVLAQVDKLWLEASRKAVQHQTQSAGASQAVEFSTLKVQVLIAPPPFIQTNLQIWQLHLGYLSLFFFPDYVLLLRRGLYSAISYSALSLDYRPIRMNVQGDFPGDAKVVGQTWLYRTANGQPDPRVSNNPKVLQVQYGFLRLLATIGLSLRLYSSSDEAAAQFTRIFQSAQTTLTRQRPDPSADVAQRQTAQRQSAHAILGVQPSASLAEIKAAYHRMARMNHPDKVAGLAPEFHTLAEQRMKMITEAYRVLTRRG